MEIIRPQDMELLRNPGVSSLQLLNPSNTSTQRLAMTRVVVQPNHEQPRHAHETAEQIWVALRGSGQLLLAEGRSAPFCEGEVARFAEGETHGFRNDSGMEFEYLSVTAPPLSFRAAYRERAAQSNKTD